MAERKATIVYVGDAASIVRASREAEAAVGKSASGISKHHSTIARSFTGMAKNIAGAAIGFAAAYASIEGIKKSVDAVRSLTEETVNLHKVTGLSVKSASAYAAVASVNGISNQKLGQSMGTLAKNVRAAVDAHDGLTKSAKTQQLAFKQLGIPITTLVKDHGNMNLVMQQVTKAFTNMPAGVNKTGVAMALFGRGWQTLVPLMKSGALGLQAQLKTAQEMGATLGGRPVKSLEELVVAQNKAKYATLGMQLAIGQYLAPAITKILTGIAGFVRGMRDGTGAGGEFKRVLEAIVNAAKPVVEWLGKHKTVTLALAAAIGTAVVAIKAVTIATAAWTAVSEANPIILLGTAIAALVAGLVVLELKTHFVEKAWRAVKVAFAAVVDWIGGAATTAFGIVKKAAEYGLLGPVGLIISHWGDVKTFFAQLPGKIAGVLKGLFNTLYNIGRNAVRGFIDGIGSLAGAVLNKIKDVVTAPITLAKSILGIGSPSKVFHEIGANIMQGLVNGLVSSRELLAEGLNTAIMYPIDAAITALDAKKAALQNIWTAIDARAQRSQLVQAIAAARAAPVVSPVTTSSGGSVSAGFSARNTANISGLNATQRTVLANLVGIGRKRGASSKDILAAVETGLVEQNLMNGAYGDGTSVGWRQETAGSYGAAVGPRLDLTRTINQFYNEIMGIGQKGSAGQLAQAVQRSAFPGRYDEKQSQALALIAAISGASGGTSRPSKIVSGVKSSASSNASSVKQAIDALKQFDDQAKRSNALAKIDLQIKNLTQLKAFKDAIAGLRTQVAGLAQQAAQAWNTLRHTAINSGPEAQRLAAMQAQDAVTQSQRQLGQLYKDLATANAGGDPQAIKDAQQAITDFNRAAVEQRLQDTIDAQNKEVDNQTQSYQDGLNAQFDVLTNELERRKITYAQWAQQVNAILAQYGLSVATDSTTETTVTAGPGALPLTSGLSKGIGLVTTTIPRHRAGGGPVTAGYPYVVGEQGAETFVPDRSGTILTAGQTRRGMPPIHVHGDMNFNGTRAARAFADRLAYRAAIGTA